MKNNVPVSYQDYQDITDTVEKVMLDNCEFRTIPIKEKEDKKVNGGDLLCCYNKLCNNSTQVSSSDLQDTKRTYDSKYDTPVYTNLLYLIMKDIQLEEKSSHATQDQNNEDVFRITDINKNTNSYEIAQEKINDLISAYLNFYNICSENHIEFMKEIYLEENFVFGHNDDTKVKKVTTFHYADKACKYRDFFNLKIQFFIHKSDNKEANGDAIFYTNIKTKELYDCLTKKDIYPYVAKSRKDENNTVEISFTFLNDKELTKIKQQRN